METAIKFGAVSLDKIYLEGSGIAMIEVQKTISNNLSKQELMRYAIAINKVNAGQNLNGKDVKLFDHIDQITMDAHKLCLKDSVVTKARIKAAKRYGIVFKDRDGLIEHMNTMLGIDDVKKNINMKTLIKSFEDRLGTEKLIKFSQIVRVIEAGKELDMQDVAVLKEIRDVANHLYDWDFIDPKTISAIDAAYEKSNSTLQTMH